MDFSHFHKLNDRISHPDNPALHKFSERTRHNPGVGRTAALYINFPFQLLFIHDIQP